MRTRLSRLKSSGGGVAAAWFMGDTGESFVFGKKPKDVANETEEDDHQPITGCRFIAKGSVLKKNQFREVSISEDSPFEETGNPNWCEFVIQENDTIGFCLDFENPKYVLVAPHRLKLAPNETQTLAVFGYLCAASGSISVDGRELKPREIITLGGGEVEITAGGEGAQVGAIELDYA